MEQTFPKQVSSKLSLSDTEIRTIDDLVEDDSFAVSPDGAYLAYFEIDRELGEARLVAEEFASGNKTTLATLTIPKGSSSSIPNIANLTWSADGKTLAFEFGRSADTSAIYLAHMDGSELVQAVDAAHAPTISSDGHCLAHISHKQVFLMDLTAVTSSGTSKPLLLGDLPTGRSNADYRLDKLQWRP